MNGREKGFTICRGNKPAGVVHNHPSGSIKLSSKDRKTAHEKNLNYVCVVAKGKTKCYRFRGEKV